MEINLEGTVIIVGNYGSGKTEVSINLAVHRKRSGIAVRIADLDLVNLYFRTREARKALSGLGIDVVVPHKRFLQADLPILSPQVSGMIGAPSQLSLLDVGGDDVGATVLASLADSFKNKHIRMLQVVNPFRPFTETIEGCMKIKDEIERASKLTIDGLIGNANLIDETTTEHIYMGYDFVKDLSKSSGLPLEFITAAAEMMTEIDLNRFSHPLLPIERQLVPPWKKAASLGPKNIKTTE
ncbi:cobalamin biosynthesis protein CbiA [Thermodesulfobacteriota bacterium]